MAFPYFAYLQEAATAVDQRLAVFWNIAPQLADGAEYVVMYFSGNINLAEAFENLRGASNQTIVYSVYALDPMRTVDLSEAIFKQLRSNRTIYDVSGITTEASESNYHIASRTITLGLGEQG